MYEEPKVSMVSGPRIAEVPVPDEWKGGRGDFASHLLALYRSQPNVGIHVPSPAISGEGKWDEKRCRVCGWPLVASRDDGCAAGYDCSQRPLPKRMADGSGDTHEFLTKLHAPPPTPPGEKVTK